MQKVFYHIENFDNLDTAWLQFTTSDLHEGLKNLFMTEKSWDIFMTTEWVSWSCPTCTSMCGGAKGS